MNRLPSLMGAALIVHGLIDLFVVREARRAFRAREEVLALEELWAIEETS